MNELALFAGAGGGILGGKLLGWRTKCAVEIDAYARKCLLNPNWTEWLMAFTVGWTDLNVLEMHKFQQWLFSHGIS
jgi:DNA (cytosine-5)-methyltransferase 1